MVPVVVFILVLVMAKTTFKGNIKTFQPLALRFTSTRRCNSPKEMVLLVAESGPFKES